MIYAVGLVSEVDTMRFSKGPWVAQALNRRQGHHPAEVGVYAQSETPGMKLVASVWGPKSKANARVIAAAPDLLTFARYFARTIDCAGVDQEPDATTLCGKCMSCEAHEYLKARGLL